MLVDDDKACLLLATLQQHFVRFRFPFRKACPLLGLAQVLGNVVFPLPLPTLWVTSSEVKGFAVTFLRVRSFFLTHGMGVGVGGSRGVFYPCPGVKPK
jgi:hypothetical protein